MKMLLQMPGANAVMLNVEKEFIVCDPRGKQLGVIRALSERDALTRAKRSTKKFPNASFLRSYTDDGRQIVSVS
jgi:hypothetical protein